jgi:putative flippase GtrA
MDVTATVRFVIVGLVATALSVVVYRAAFLAGTSPLGATALRMGVFLPCVYLGYSRWMLDGTFRDERVALGPWGAERRMMARVAASVGASTLLKIVLEPRIATALAGRFGREAATLSPLLADLGYGPAANYLVLAWSSRRRPRAGRTS